MLVIIKEFKLGIKPDDIQEIEKKLKEFGIRTLGVRPFRTTISGHEFMKMYIECQSSPEQLKDLTTYLAHEFKGIASIIS
jgi:hypothetical protein